MAYDPTLEYDPDEAAFRLAGYRPPDTAALGAVPGASPYQPTPENTPAPAPTAPDPASSPLGTFVAAPAESLHAPTVARDVYARDLASPYHPGWKSLLLGGLAGTLAGAGAPHEQSGQVAAETTHNAIFGPHTAQLEREKAAAGLEGTREDESRKWGLEAAAETRAQAAEARAKGEVGRKGADIIESDGQNKQWNPATQKYDIDAGAATPNAAAAKAREWKPSVDVNGVPTGVYDPSGKFYAPEDPTLLMPGNEQGKALMDSIKSGHTRGRDEKLADANTVEGNRLASADASDARKGRTAANKLFEPAYNAESQWKTMQTAADESRKGNQQAMFQLLSAHIGMTAGQNKGARITQAMYDEAVKSAPWLSTIGARFLTDGSLDPKSGIVLTKPQIEQMLALGHTKYAETVRSAHERFAGAQLPVPDGWKEPKFDIENESATSGGGTIRARDPQGRLHEAPAGSKLPAGWKAEASAATATK